ncbi:sulfatase-like hydrolase/transferase [Micromonospora echinofusca]|uniref:Sulfatase-like hydrolase/transferase n=1 Tax=Micromonospora echinofusca TaxID=47858 RepID=A0ABS3VQ86_MICEH|nr:sulfatase-like hydrolase/transferase [Micromonospora echinofusca]MBO4206638.1 sulfatase-like hydrolase/transferase [Micromonospora echinofusca]
MASAARRDRPPVTPPARSRRRWGTELRRQLELVGLTGLAVAQPLLDVTGRSPDFFLFHRATRGEILLLVAVFVAGPPVLFGLLGAASRLAGTRTRQVVHAGTVAVLLAALAVQAGKHLLPLRGVPLAVLAVVVGVAGAAARYRWRAVRLALRAASVGPLVFVGLFVLASPASAVLLPTERAGAGPGTAQSPGRHPPVVMIILDEFPLGSLLTPDGRLDAARYPHFAELAAGSTWYRNASGVSGWTPYALPAMLTGRYPQEAVPPHFSRYPDNLFTAFGGLYDIRAQESVTELCPPSRCGERTGAGHGGLPVLLRESGELLARMVAPVDSRVDPEAVYREVTRAEAGLDAAVPVPTDPKFRWDTLDDNQPVRFTEFLAGLRPSNRPTLHFLHLLMPHSPWAYLPSGARYDAPEDLPNDGAGWLDLARQRHLAQVGYTDRLIGETLRVLRATGLYDDALLVVTADHGVSFTAGAQGRGMDAVRGAAGEVLRVPLFVKEPGQRAGRMDERNWEHVDLLPTVADLARIRLAHPVDGRSARGAPRATAEKSFYDRPGERVSVPPLPPAVGPAPNRSALVGRSVTDLRVTGGAGPASVLERAAFRDVDPAEGGLPALVSGTVPAGVPDGTQIAVAVNGRIGAVVPVVPPGPGGRRFAALLTDDALFAAGSNRLELYAVAPGPVLRRFALG